MGSVPNNFQVQINHGNRQATRNLGFSTLVKYIFVNVLCYSNRILFIVVSIKNIVDMNSNKQFVQ